MTLDQIVSAIRALPVPERLRVIELVAHDAVSDVPSSVTEVVSGGVTLTECKGLLVADVDTVLPAEAFGQRS